MHVPRIRVDGFNNNFEKKIFGEIVRSISTRLYIKSVVSDLGEYEVIQQGDTPILGYSDDQPFEKYKSVILFGDHTLSLYRPKAPFLLATDGIKILQSTILKRDYLYYLTQNYIPKSQGYKRHFSVLKQVFVNYSRDFSEQSAIGTLFRTLDELLASYKDNLANYQSLKATMLSKMFPKAGQTVPEIRLDGFEGEWKEKTLGSLGSVAMNKRIFKDETSENGDIPFYKIGTFGGTADAFISKEKFEEYKEKYPYPDIGDILISASGSIGRTVVYNGENAYYQDSNIVWLKHDQQLDNSYLKQYYGIIKWSGIEGTTIKRLYNKNILETNIFLPPSVAEQQAIGSYFSNLDNLINSHQEKITQLETLKKKLLHDMFI